MRILIFNWRDTKNPQSGGAEILTHEMAKRWVTMGHSVVQFSAAFSGAKSEEILDGVKIIRQGSPFVRSGHLPVHVAAFFWYRKLQKGTFDVVIDEVHGIPFFTPWYVREPKVALVCEVAKEIWDINFRFPIRQIGKTLERLYLLWYRSIPILTISPSTKQDLVDYGARPECVSVLPMGITLPPTFPKVKKEKYPTLIIVGRLAKAKGIEDAIGAVLKIQKKFSFIQLWIVGQGDASYMRVLQNIVKALGLSSCVRFWGFVTTGRKFELLARAHILLAPSYREGWGLTVAEAGRVGTPSVVYDVPGLRDVGAGSGLVVSPNAGALASGVEQLLSDARLYHKYQKSALAKARACNWDRTANTALTVLLEATNKSAK